MAEIKQLERGSSKIKFKVMFSKDEVQKAYSKTISSLSKEIKVPGFRKGKVPPNIVRMHLGKERLMSEVIDTLFPDVYSQAKKELEFEPVGYPEILDIDFEDGKESFFDVEVDIQPDITLPDLSEIEVEKLRVSVDDKEVEDAIEELRNSMAILEPKETEEVEGDPDEVVFIKLDIDPHDEDLEQKYKDLFHKEEVPVYFKVENPEGLDKEIMERLKGKKIGEEISFSYEFPDDFYIKDLKGKKVDVSLTVKDIKKITIPDANDELAKELEYENFEELKKDVYDRLLKEKEEREEIRFENEIIKKLLERVEFEVPESYVKRRIETLKKELMDELKKQNLTLREYLESRNLDEETLNNYYREEAVTQLKISMVLDEIEEEYKIDITEEDVEKELKLFASYYRITEDKAKELYEKDEEVKSYINYKIRRKKVMEFLKEKVKVKEVDSLEEEESEDADDENK